MKLHAQGRVGVVELHIVAVGIIEDVIVMRQAIERDALRLRTIQFA